MYSYSLSKCHIFRYSYSKCHIFYRCPQVIECPRRAKPAGIVWAKITREKMRRVPILRKLREMEREAGKDVSIYEDIHGEIEKEGLGENGPDGK